MQLREVGERNNWCINVFSFLIALVRQKTAKISRRTCSTRGIFCSGPWLAPFTGTNGPVPDWKGTILHNSSTVLGGTSTVVGRKTRHFHYFHPSDLRHRSASSRVVKWLDLIEEPWRCSACLHFSDFESQCRKWTFVECSTSAHTQLSRKYLPFILSIKFATRTSPKLMSVIYLEVIARTKVISFTGLCHLS